MPLALDDFLHSLSHSDSALLSPHLKAVKFNQGDVLAETGVPINQVYFPESGLISIVVELATGDRLEAALAGRDGVVGGAAGLGGTVHVNTAVGQMPGTCQVLKVSNLIDAARKSETLRSALFRYEQYMLAQAQQSAACNARHQIPQRLATWLLRVQDAAKEDELSLTQEFLAQMLGVQRASISLVAASLQDRGVIRYRRGHVRIVDFPGLESTACECYAALRTQRERLFGQDQSVKPKGLAR